MIHLLKAFTDIIFPPHIDVTVARGISEENLISRVAFEHNEDHSIHTGLLYSDPGVRALIRANKFRGDKHSSRVLGAALGEILTQMFDEHALDSAWQEPLLIPIPLSKERLRLRGFNQVERIINYIPEEALQTFEFNRTVLKRHDRPSQTLIPRSERPENIREAFFVSKNEYVKGKNIFLIDDVSESGATLQDAMRALREAGAANVIGIALAK